MAKRFRLYVLIIVILLLVLLTGIYAYMTGVFLPRDLSAYRPSSNSGNVYYILPIGGADKFTLDYMQSFLESDSKLPCKVLMSVPVPEDHGNRDKQVDVDKLRPLLTSSGLIPADAFRVIGITMHDIFWKDYNFIFGLGGVGPKGCIVSMNRMKPAGIPEIPPPGTSHPGVKLYEERIRRIVRHELGHTLGLDHCYSQGCVMRYDDNIVDFDDSGEFFCPQCRLTMSLHSPG